MKKEGEFWIEFAPPFTAPSKLDKLKEFIDEHDQLGGLDKKFLRQVLGELEAKGLRVTQFKAGIKKVENEKHTQAWTAAFVINNVKEFKGEAVEFAEAFLAMVESFDNFLKQAEAS